MPDFCDASATNGNGSQGANFTAALAGSQLYGWMGMCWGAVVGSLELRARAHHPAPVSLANAIDLGASCLQFAPCVFP